MSSPYAPGQYIQQGVPTTQQNDPYLALAKAQPDPTLDNQLSLANQLRAAPLKTNAMAGRVVQKVTPFAAMANVAQNVVAQTQENKVLAAQKQQAQMLRDTRGRLISEDEARQNALNSPDKNHPTTNMQLMAAEDPQAQSTAANFGLGGGNVSPDVPGA